MGEFKFGAVSIFEIGEAVSRKLSEDGVEGEATITIPIQEDKFLKVDEDLFYRTRKEGETFVPSDSEIVARYSANLKFVIVKENKKKS